MFSIDLGSTKERHLRRDPRVSVLVSPPTEPYTYAAIHGRAALVTDEPGELLNRLARKYTSHDYADHHPEAAARRASVSTKRGSGCFRAASKTEPLASMGATAAPDPAAAVAASPLTLVCVNDTAAVTSVLQDAGGALSGQTVVNLTSSTPDEARKMVDLVAARGARYLDGTIMVPPPAIGDEAAVCFYSGDRSVFDDSLEVLRTIAGDARFLGTDPGLAVLYNTVSDSCGRA